MTLPEFLSQSDVSDEGFAQMVGRDRSTVTRWRRGDTKPEPTMVFEIERLTGGRVTRHDIYPHLYPREEAGRAA